MFAEIAAGVGLLAGVCGVAGATFQHRRAVFYKLDAQAQRNIIAERDTVITNLQHKCAELAEEVDKWADARRAISRAGGLARGMQRRKLAEQKANAARGNTLDALKTAPLRPREEVVAGARESRRGHSA